MLHLNVCFVSKNIVRNIEYIKFWCSLKQSWKSFRLLFSINCPVKIPKTLKLYHLKTICYDSPRVAWVTKSVILTLSFLRDRNFAFKYLILNVSTGEFNISSLNFRPSPVFSSLEWHGIRPSFWYFCLIILSYQNM